MSEDFSNRMAGWKPNPRPEWVARLNAEGDHMDIKGVVPLDENSLLDAARDNTGLSDFGDDDWYEPFKILVKAFDEESELNLIGRLTTRSEMLMFLEARLQIEDTFKKHPEIHDEQIEKPLLVIGQGRSGTSVLYNMLSEDPNNGHMKNWEVFFPCPPPEKATYHTDPRIKKAEPLCTQINRIIPEIQTMHEFSAEIPTENIHLHCLTFRSPTWFNPFGGQVPTYNAYMATQPMKPVFEYEKKVFKLLQWKNPRKRWQLKSPASIMHLPELLEVYPDIQLLWIHRDPIKSLASMVNLMGTLFWSRTDHPFIGNSLEMYTNAELSAQMITQPIDWIEQGIVPKQQLCNIHYQDFIKAPLETVIGVYEYFGMDLPEASRRAMQQYMDNNPRTSRPAHRYSTGERKQIARERKAYARYQEYFNVASEV